MCHEFEILEGEHVLFLNYFNVSAFQYTLEKVKLSIIKRGNSKLMSKELLSSVDNLLPNC